LEWQFYLVAPFLITALARSGPWMFAALFAASIWMCGSTITVGGQVYTFAGGSFLPLSLVYFLIGIGSYLMLDYVRALPHMGAAFPLMASGAVVWLTGSYVAAVWVVLYAAITISRQLERPLALKPLTFLGTISFSVYLVHLIVIVLFQYQIVHKHFAFGTWSYFAALSTLSIPATLGVSWAAYRWIETPSIQIGRRLSWNSVQKIEIEQPSATKEV
jgi:peptidoglycan/LPS O-acetylase OafA/YrhL